MTDLKKLFAEFPREAISWRAQSVTKDGTKAMALAYIDARDVMNRLDEVCGIDGWQRKYSHANGKTICDLGIKCGDEWIWKADGAGDTDIEAEKGAISDAFKRAAVNWGVGRYLYDMPCPWVACETYEVNGKKKWSKWTEDPWKYVKPTKPDTSADAKLHPSFKNFAERMRLCEELLADISASDDPVFYAHNERLEDIKRCVNDHYETRETFSRAIDARKKELAAMDLSQPTREV